MTRVRLIEQLCLDTFKTLEQCGFTSLSKRMYKKDPLYFRLAYTPIKKIGENLNQSYLLKIQQRDFGNTILFNNSKHLDLIQGIKDKSNILVCSGFQDLLLSKFNTIYIPKLQSIGYNTLKDIEMGEIEDNEDINHWSTQIDKEISKIRKIIKQLSPTAIVFSGDSSLQDRAIILAAKEESVPTINLQEGIYQSQVPIIHGRAADYVFVWGRFFKSLYLKQKIRSSRTIKILGYPHKLKPLPTNPKEPRLTIYYLGQNFEIYDKKLLEPKLETIKELNKICKDFDIDFIYRPHPRDPKSLLENSLPNVEFAVNETLNDSFKRGDVFVSFNSTTLIEAALHNKLGIQLKNYPLPTDDFEKMGVCKSFNNVEELKPYLKVIAESKDLEKFGKGVDQEYIKIPDPDPSTRFLELIDEVT